MYWSLYNNTSAGYNTQPQRRCRVFNCLNSSLRRVSLSVYLIYYSYVYIRTLVAVYEHHRYMALYIPGPRRTYYITAHHSHYSNVMAVNITQHVHVMTVPAESAQHCCMNIEFSSLYGVESWVFLYHRLSLFLLFFSFPL